jgi:hypothetical protein
VRIGASGLRSSWARVARNSSLRRSASLEARLRSVTSALVPTKPRNAPERPNLGWPQDSSQCHCPSARSYPDLSMEGGPRPHADQELVGIAPGVLGVHQHLPAVSRDLLGAHAKELAEGAVDEFLAAFGIVDPDHQRQPVGHGAEAGLALAQGFLVAVPLRQVIEVAHDAGTPVSERHTLDLPVVGLGLGVVLAAFDGRRRVIGLASFERCVETGRSPRWQRAPAR